MADLFHECGIAAVYQLPGEISPLVSGGKSENASRIIPRLLLEIQNRGQLAAGMTSYRPDKDQLLETHKDVGSVSEVFHISRQPEYEPLMESLSGPAAIGHVRYATCGRDDRNYAQPFERSHIEKTKWFSFAFNGQLSNYRELRDEILSRRNFHLSRDTDTEILMHLLCEQLSGDRQPRLHQVLSALAQLLDGAYNIAFLNARGDMFVARDPLGLRPLCYSIEDNLFLAASESVALANLGVPRDRIYNLEPGHAIIIEDGRLRKVQFAESPGSAHCFFEWIYFANVASVLDERSVYLTRKRLGEALAHQETLTCDDQTIVVPVPDTAKAAADSMAFELKVPSLEGLIRNRYVGRTFIDGANRADKVRMKYTPLPEVLRGKRVLLVEDTIVRSTTMKALISQIRERGEAKEIHVRVACPPIIAPCFYGIDMSTVTELFAPKYLDGHSGRLTPEIEARMASDLGADSLRFLDPEAIANSVGLPAERLCQGCITGDYPTPTGQRLYQLAREKSLSPSNGSGRIFDEPLSLAAK